MSTLSQFDNLQCSRCQGTNTAPSAKSGYWAHCYGCGYDGPEFVLPPPDDPKHDQINDARQNLRLPQERKDAYARDAHSMGLTLPEYTRLALAEKLERTPAKILALLTAIEKRLREGGEV